MKLPEVPTAEIVASVLSRVKQASREEFDAWRVATADILNESGARSETMNACTEWAQAQIQSGRMSQPEAGVGMLGGAMISTFQLGLLVGAVLYGGLKFEELPEGKVQ